jgi:hypothetical protein
LIDWWLLDGIARALISRNLTSHRPIREALPYLRKIASRDAEGATLPKHLNALPNPSATAQDAHRFSSRDDHWTLRANFDGHNSVIKVNFAAHR